MSIPLVSVVVPVYNVELYIHKCVKSIISQTFCDFEVLIINDGTPDKSMEVLEGFDDPRIKRYNKCNGGLSDARNFGLSRCKGEYVCFVDSDDWIEPNYLLDLLSAAQKTASDVVICGLFTDQVDLQEITRASLPACHPTAIYERDHTQLPNDEGAIALLGYAWNKLYRREVLERAQAQFPVGVSLVEDMIFNQTVISSSRRISFLEKPLYHYSDRQKPSLMKKYYPDALELKIRRMTAIDKLYSDWGTSQQDRDRIVSAELTRSLRYSFDNLFCYGPQESFWKRLSRVKHMLNSQELCNFLSRGTPTNQVDKILVLLARYRLSLLTAVLFEIMKRKRRKEISRSAEHRFLRD